MRYSRNVSISFGPPLTPMVKNLLIITSAVFVLTYIPAQLFGWVLPYRWLSLQPYSVVHHLTLWQLVTYLFLHGGFFHVIFNMFALWMFGSDLERLWGSRRFLFFYLFTGAGAGLLDVLFHQLLRPNALTATVGCSGAIYGILLAYGLLFPDRPIFLWLIIPMKAKWFVLLIGVIEFVSSISGPGSGISHVAHLGGMFFAYLFLRWSGFSFRFRANYDEWRRGRLRRKFESYMRQQERKDKSNRWIN